MMSDTYDVIIVGGAAVGSSVAFFLSRHAGFDGRVLVVERDPAYATCSTTLSAASIRQQFSTAINIRISQFGIDFLRALPDEFGTDADVGFREKGYLILSSGPGEATLKANFDIQTEHGASTVWVTPDDLKTRYPWMSTEGIAAGNFGPNNEGWFDSHTLLQTFRSQAINNGVDYVKGEVSGLTRTNNQITAVELSDGRSFTCGCVVNAAGPNARNVAGMAGLSLPVESRKRFVYVIDCREKDTITDCPLLIDASGVYVRPEGEYFITGVSPPADQDPECFDFDVDYSLFEETIWPTLATRVPAFEAIKVVNAWAGHYAYNTLDQNAVVGPHPELANFYYANGFSGHGLQQSPAVGRGIAELITDGRYTTLDLGDLAYTRIIENRPLLEANVI
jgi:FAD-dependent oxidoreductase domain-containing protein 1